MSARRVLSFRWVLAAAGLTATSAALPQPDIDDWMAMSQRVIDARHLLGSHVTNGVTPMGLVREIVLAPDGGSVQHILFEVPYPASLWGAEDGFVDFDDISLDPGLGFDVQVRFDEQDSVRLPEELNLSGESLDGRLVSRLLQQEIRFEGGTELEVRNMLIDRETGEVTHYVVETDTEALLRSERRTVPADRIDVRDDGGLTASLRMDELDALQEFDPAFL